jgi:hypothetical protein
MSKAKRLEQIISLRDKLNLHIAECEFEMMDALERIVECETKGYPVYRANYHCAGEHRYRLFQVKQRAEHRIFRLRGDIIYISALTSSKSLV